MWKLETKITPKSRRQHEPDGQNNSDFLYNLLNLAITEY